MVELPKRIIFAFWSVKNSRKKYYLVLFLNVLRRITNLENLPWKAIIVAFFGLEESVKPEYLFAITVQSLYSYIIKELIL